VIHRVWVTGCRQKKQRRCSPASMAVCQQPEHVHMCPQGRRRTSGGLSRHATHTSAAGNEFSFLLTANMASVVTPNRQPKSIDSDCCCASPPASLHARAWAVGTAQAATWIATPCTGLGLGLPRLSTSSRAPPFVMTGSTGIAARLCMSSDNACTASVAEETAPVLKGQRSANREVNRGGSVVGHGRVRVKLGRSKAGQS